MRSQTVLDYVIKPALHKMGDRFNSKEAQQLLLITMAVESDMGKYIKQIGGPAYGVYQVEPETHVDIWRSYLNYRDEIADKILAMLPDNARGNTSMAMSARNGCLITDMAYSTCIARLVYFRSPAAIPEFNDKDGMWDMYKKVYNTHLGATTRETFMGKWSRFIENVEY